MDKKDIEELKEMQYVHTGFMKSVTSGVMSHLFTFDLEFMKITVSIGQVVMGLFGTLGLGLLGFYIFGNLGGVATIVPAVMMLLGMFGLLIMTVLNKGAVPRSKIGANMQEFASDSERTKVQYLYTGVTPNKKGYLDFEDGRVGKIYLIDGILSKTTMVAPLESSARQREGNYIGREDDIQEDNHILVSNLNKREALSLIRQGIEDERVSRKNNPSLFFQPFMDMQEKMMRLSNTSVLNEYMILTASSLDGLENEEGALSTSGALTSMIPVRGYEEMKKILGQIAFFEEG